MKANAERAMDAFELLFETKRKTMTKGRRTAFT